MQHFIEHGPSFPWLRIKLAPGESIMAEAGAMVTRSANLDMKTSLNAGTAAGFFRKVAAFFIALMRKIIGGETMFVNTFSGPQGGEVIIAPSLSGNVVHHPLTGGRTLIVQGGSYLASTGTVETKMKWAGLRGLFGGEGLFFLECTGQGDLWINAYGGITPVPVNGTYIVDTGHMVAFEGNLDFSVRGAGGGLKSLFFSGEGLVCEFNGQGTVYIQSRNLGALVGWISRFLR